MRHATATSDRPPVEMVYYLFGTHIDEAVTGLGYYTPPREDGVIVTHIVSSMLQQTCNTFDNVCSVYVQKSAVIFKVLYCAITNRLSSL